MVVQRCELVLEGLNCASCAAKIEDKAQKLPGVHNAILNFPMRKLVFDLEGDEAEILRQIQKEIDIIEPGVLIRPGAIDGKGNPSPEVPINQWELGRLVVGGLIFAIALGFELAIIWETILYGLSYLLVGTEVLIKSLRNIRRGQIFDENFLMVVATVGALAIGEYPEAVAVMLFYQIGELFQGIAVSRSRNSIAALMDIRPDFANLKQGEIISQVDPDTVQIGELVLVKPGEKIPLDGRVLDGFSLVDTSAMTGESLPREVEAGTEVLAGFINQTGVLTIEVTREFGQSTVAKILDLVENAAGKKAPTESFITKFARYYTPAVVFIALGVAILPPLLMEGATFADWVYRALILLVISCPCALVVSIPLGFFGGIGGASRNGILVKGGNYLEALNDVKTVVFDKTGTLTKGVFKVTEVIPTTPYSQEQLLEFAALAEVYSNHPVAKSISQAYGQKVVESDIGVCEEIPGQGIRVVVAEREILAGNGKLMQRAGIEFPIPQVVGTVVYVAVDGAFAGYIVIADQLKSDAHSAIQQLRELGVQKIVMLTGDTRTVAAEVGKELQLDAVFAELLPHQKVEQIENLYKVQKPGEKLVFVGDGINDAPVLARADVGVAMGGMGSDAAIEAADVVLMTDELSKLVGALRIARKTKTVVWQNIILAFGVKGLVLLLGAGGMATMWEAVFADVGVALLAILNAMRVLRYNP